MVTACSVFPPHSPPPLPLSLPAGDDSEVDLVDVLDHLAFNEYQLGNVKRAAQYTEQLLQNGEEQLPLHSFCLE